MMQNNQLIQIKQRIEEIQEYIETELCKKCDSMRLQLIALQAIIDQYEDENHTRNLDPFND